MKRPVEHEWQRIIREELHEELREKELKESPARRMSSDQAIRERKV